MAGRLILKAVSRSGLEGLRPELRQLLPDVDLSNREHRRRFSEAIRGVGGNADPSLAGSGMRVVSPVAAEDDQLHSPMDPADFEHMYEAMTLWDEFMASSIAGYVRTEPKQGAGPFGGTSLGTERMVVLVGSSHVRGRVGIPDRFSKRTKLDTFTMVPASWTSAGRPAGSEKLPASEADWVLYTRPQLREQGLSLMSAKRFSKGAIYL